MSNQRQVQSTTTSKLKNFWRTSERAYRDACHLCGIKGFGIDVAADRENKLCTYYLNEEANALSFSSWFSDSWVALDSAWCNPPFDRKEAFLEKAFEQAKIHSGKLICVMIPYEPATQWWRKYVQDKASIVYVPDGRYSFVHPETNELISGVNFASCFVVFTGLTMATVYHHFVRGCGELKEAS